VKRFITSFSGPVYLFRPLPAAKEELFLKE
jgi:hypothetical protein